MEFYCSAFRSIDEYSGSIQYGGNGTDKHLGRETFVQLTALIVCLAAWGITDRSSFMELKNVEPKYMLLGGAIGAFITITVIKSMEALGPARAVMLIVTAQLLVAYLIELFGIFGVDKQPFQWSKVVGMALAIAGILVFKWE